MTVSNEELLRRYHNGDRTAFKQLMINNDRATYHIARRLKGSNGADLEDLASIARLGLVKAIETFKVDKGFRFTTYSYKCMQNEILYNLNRDKKWEGKLILLEQPIWEDGEGDTLTLMDILETKELNPLESYLEKERIKALRKVIQELPDRDRFIIDEIYFKGRTQTDVAKDLGRATSNVTYHLKKILGRIRLQLEGA